MSHAHFELERELGQLARERAREIDDDLSGERMAGQRASFYDSAEDFEHGTPRVPQLYRPAVKGCG